MTLRSMNIFRWASAMLGVLFATPALAATDCAVLKNMHASIPMVVQSAEAVSASPSNRWQTPSGMRQSVEVGESFCRVVASVRPTPTSDIRIEVWLPVTWNGKFFGTASGGSAGSIDYHALVDPLQRGYAAMGHNNGHVSSVFDASWAYDEKRQQPDMVKIEDYAWRAQHVATVVGKELVNAFYNKPPTRSYYVGCSQGGHHGQMESQRFPTDYDGIVAGSCGGDWTSMMTSEAWAAYTVTRDSRAGGIPKPLLPLLANYVMSSCDGLDGLVDGQIEDPRRCAPNLAALACTDHQSSQCLTEAQIVAVENLYAGPHDPKTGKSLAPGYAPGSEANWATTWNAETQPHSGSYFDFYRLLVRGNPAWEIGDFRWPQDVEDARAKWDAVYGALDANLTPFASRGGKLIMFHGLADPLMPAGQSLRYWERLNAAMGKPAVDRFARLFLIPGMAHCGGGPEGSADWLTAIERWVEQGIPPDAGTSNAVIGTGTVGVGTPRRRAYCAFPKVSKYKGSGDVNAPGSFSCAAA